MKTLRETFLQRLFFVKYKFITPLLGTLSTTTVKKCGLGLQNTVISEIKTILSSQREITYLICFVTGKANYPLPITFR